MGVNYRAVELDRMTDGRAIQNALLKKTGQRTVPNIFIGGEHVGGFSELQEGLRAGQVQRLFEKHRIQFKAQ